MTEEKLQSFRAVLGSTNPFGFESQLWRINNEGRLENLQGEWKYSNSTWSIPNEGKDGYITDLELGKVLEIESRGLELNVNLTILPRNTNQIWKRGQQDVDGWFTLKNSRRSLFLSRKSNFSLTGYSLSEALILASINPKYGDRLFIELQVKYLYEKCKLRTCCAHKLLFIFVLTLRTIYVHNMFCACNFHVLNL